MNKKQGAPEKKNKTLIDRQVGGIYRQKLVKK